MKKKTTYDLRTERMDYIFDTHAHYDDEAFDADREEVLTGLKEQGVGTVVNVGASIASTKTTLALAETHPFMYAAVGVHPNETAELTDADMKWLESLAENPKVVAIGEIGLDYYWDEPEREIQKHWFTAQLEVTKKTGLPVIIHSRDAAKDTLDIMKVEHNGATGSDPSAFHGVRWRECLNMGYYIGIGGVLTFKNAKKLIEVAEYAPPDRIVLETDCSYLAPVPNCEREIIPEIAVCGGEAGRDQIVSKEEIIRETTKNARALYRMPEQEFRMIRPIGLRYRNSIKFCIQDASHVTSENTLREISPCYRDSRQGLAQARTLARCSRK